MFSINSLEKTLNLNREMKDSTHNRLKRKNSQEYISLKADSHGFKLGNYSGENETTMLPVVVGTRTTDNTLKNKDEQLSLKK